MPSYGTATVSQINNCTAKRVLWVTARYLLGHATPENSEHWSGLIASDVIDWTEHEWFLRPLLHIIFTNDRIQAARYKMCDTTVASDIDDHFIGLAGEDVAAQAGITQGGSESDIDFLRRGLATVRQNELNS